MPGHTVVFECHCRIAQAADDARVGRRAGRALGRHGPGHHAIDQRGQAFDKLFRVEAARLMGQAGLIADGRHGNRGGFRV